ncbi:MAG: PilZ domain protein [Sphingomonas bacterium]|nr:PilZ domain protein [Sphingomonas bacterium]
MVCDVRLATVNRVARLFVADEPGLARLHRISDGGVELSSTMDLQIGQMVQLDLSETVSTRATVIAGNGQRYDLAFEHKVNCAELLRQLVAEARSSRSRPLRLTTGPIHANVRSLLGVHQLELKDISQRGMKVRHDGSFQAGLRVSIQLPNGRECRGIVQWTDERCAGLQLLDILSADELGSISRLRAIPIQMAGLRDVS